MERAFARYLRHHRALGSSPKTIKGHVDSSTQLLQFLTTCGHSLKLEDLAADDVRGWITDQQDRGLAQKTIHNRVINIKAFARWCVAEEWLPRDPLARVKRPKVDDKPKAALSPEEVDTLLRAVNRGSWLGVRNLAAMLLLFSTGLRAGELLALDVADLDWHKGLITIRRAKGGKYRVVPLTGKAERALDRYLNHPKRPNSPHVFVSPGGVPMTYDALHQVFRHLTAKTGIACSPHKWRHSAAIAYLRGGGRVEVLRSLLGHSTLDMSLHYARIAGIDLTEAHITADPARSLKVRV